MIRRDKSHHSRHHLMKELMKLLELTQPEDLLPCVESLCKHHKQHAQTLDFIQRFQVIVTACSPPAAFTEPPTLPQMWKWVRRLVEEYMRVRKTDAEEVLGQMRMLLRAKTNEEVVRCATRQTADWQSMSTVMEKLKMVLGLGPKVGLEAIDEALSTMLANPGS